MFLAPYVNDTKANDPIMERVLMDTFGIGGMSSGLPRLRKFWRTCKSSTSADLVAKAE